VRGYGKIIEEYPERDYPDIETCLIYATLPADMCMKCLKCFEGQPQMGVASLTYEHEGSAGDFLRVISNGEEFGLCGENHQALLHASLTIARQNGVKI
jgi:hypothetical protein